jgi:hypothetical protein
VTGVTKPLARLTSPLRVKKTKKKHLKPLTTGALSVILYPMKETYTSYKQIRKNLNLKADIARTRRQSYYLELIISALVGASITLMGVIAHMMISGPAWTW